MPFDVVSYVLARRGIRGIAQQVVDEHRQAIPIDHPKGSITIEKFTDETLIAIYTRYGEIVLDANTYSDERVQYTHTNITVSFKYWWTSKGSYGPRLGVGLRSNDDGSTKYAFVHATGEYTYGPHRISKYVNGTVTHLASGLGSDEDVNIVYVNDACEIVGSTLTFVDRGVVIGSVTDTDIPSGNNVFFGTWDSGNVVHLKNIIIKVPSSYRAPPEKHVYLRVPKVIVVEDNQESMGNPLTVLSRILFGRPIPVVTVADLGKELIVAVHEGIAGDLAIVLPRLSEDDVVNILREKGVKIKTREELYEKYYGWNIYVDRKPITRDEAQTLAKELTDLLAKRVKSYERITIKVI